MDFLGLFYTKKFFFLFIFSFEKLFSGLYLGEIVRQVLADMTKMGILFDNIGSEKLFTPWTFQTTYVTDIERYVIVIFTII